MGREARGDRERPRPHPSLVTRHSSFGRAAPRAPGGAQPLARLPGRGLRPRGHRRALRVVGRRAGGSGGGGGAAARGWQERSPTLSPPLLARLPGDALVYDLTYRQTPILQAAAARGLATLDGLAMVVEQGALAWQLWTGRQAPRAVMRQAALAAR